jgi:hypothetical protein
MAKEPGNLSDFEGAAQDAWNELIAGYFRTNASAHLLAQPDARTPEVVAVEWGAYPVRIAACLESTANSHRLLDWTTTQGAVGRAHLQEEYFEWRVVRGGTGKIQRVEMTTELPEYWLTLAAHHPLTTLRLIARFAGEAEVPPEAVYGLDPFAAGVTPSQRQLAFEDAMLPRGGTAPWSPYNNGEKAICFMTQGANTLGALIHLVAAAAFPFGMRDSAGGELRKLSGPEAIATGTQAAQACRNSDPTVVGATIGLAWDGRLFALDDPIGIYIRSVQHSRLVQPNGEPVPSEWFEFQRGARPHAPGDLERSQRLVLEVPPGYDFVVGDLVDTDTDQRIEYGGQVADLVQLAAYVRISAPGAGPAAKREVPRPDVRPCVDDPACGTVRGLWDDYTASERNFLGGTPDRIADRGGAIL